MFSSLFRGDAADSARTAGQLAAINKSMAVITFNVDGTIVDANANFFSATGYSLDEIRGKHHRMFVEPEFAASAEYRRFWERLASGEYQAGRFFRVGKGGREIWIQASYNPILDRAGKTVGIVKFATDITEEMAREASQAGQLAAIGKAMAVIEFALDGTILDANQNFLDVTGYSLDEIRGRHHGMFVEPAYRESAAYRAFWEKLGRGEFDAGQYVRVGKDGREINIQASYNPIFDARGRPCKVVKFATDLSKQRATRVLQDALAETLATVAAAKQKNLGKRIPLEGKRGDIERLCTGVNDLLDNVCGIVDAIRSASSQSLAASTEISEASRELSRRSETQAATLEEIAATIEEMSETTSRTATTASQSAEVATSTAGKAAKGTEVARSAISAIEEVQAEASRIVAIVDMMDSLSFQTNLLALNASVEAARAGDAGRGFAVVADEVRRLAQQSATSAKDVRDVVAKVTGIIASGAGRVRDVGTALVTIASDVQIVSGAFGEIARATSEQATGVGEIARAVQGLDANTQANAAATAETNRAAEQLVAILQRLAEEAAGYILEIAARETSRSAARAA